MRTMMMRGLLAAAMLGSAFTPDLAAARPRYYNPAVSVYDNGGFAPAEGPQPNGCVKWCPFDQTPCDPPVYKHADGRCNMER